MVGLQILVKIHQNHRSEFLQAFDMVKNYDQLPGVRKEVELYEMVNEFNTFLWLEQWDNAESLNHYCQSNRFKAMMGAVSILGEMIQSQTLIIEEEENATL